MRPRRVGVQGTRGYLLVVTGVWWRQLRTSTFLELRAAALALKALLWHQQPLPKHVHLRLDNTTAVAYINKRGGGVGHTLPCPDHSATGTLGSSPGSRSIPDSSAYSRVSEWSSRHCLQTDRNSEQSGLWTKGSTNQFVRGSTHRKWTFLHLA